MSFFPSIIKGLLERNKMKKFKDIYKTLKVRDIIYSDAGENYLDISIVVEITEETIRFKKD
jgi:hypothetical protein